MSAENASPINRTMPTADSLNAALNEGRRVQVTTYGRSTIYGPRNAGCFKNGAKSGDLYVQRGKNWDCIGTKGCGLLVSVRILGA